MLHSDAGELHQLYATFTLVWREGRGASLFLETVDGKVSAVLKVLFQPLALELQRHTTKQLDVLIISLDSNAAAIIVDQAQEAARRGTWKKHKQARNPELQPTPPPAAPSRRLVTVVREKTRSRSSFCQLLLDGKAGDKHL